MYDTVKRYTYVYQKMEMEFRTRNRELHDARAGLRDFPEKAGVQKMQEKGRKTEWSVYRMGNGKL